MSMEARRGGRDLTVERVAVLSHPILQEEWYHSIELVPGLFTKGFDHDNIALTREMLKGCSVDGANCLDIGAMDCLTTLLLLRRGAERVTAYDRRDHHLKAAFLQEVMGVSFTYLTGVKLMDLRSKLRPFSTFPFDLVVFSGVLYHMFDPLGGLAAVRGLVRNGGLVVLETSAIVDDRMAAYFNAHGRFYPRTTYWQISLECLDYLLRFLRLQALDCVYRLHHVDKQSGLQICRAGIVCRALKDALSGPDDEWLGEQGDGRERDFQEFLDWSELQTRRPPVGYRIADRALVVSPETQTVDLLATVRATQPLALTDPDTQVRLRLDAIY